MTGLTEQQKQREWAPIWCAIQAWREGGLSLEKMRSVIEDSLEEAAQYRAARPAGDDAVRKDALTNQRWEDQKRRPDCANCGVELDPAKPTEALCDKCRVPSPPEQGLGVDKTDGWEAWQDADKQPGLFYYKEAPPATYTWEQIEKAISEITYEQVTWRGSVGDWLTDLMPLLRQRLAPQPERVTAEQRIKAILYKYSFAELEHDRTACAAEIAAELAANGGEHERSDH